MRSIIIGGTSGLGRHIAEELLSRGSQIITLSRAETGFPNSPHFQCELLDQEKLMSICLDIRNKNSTIDNVWCVAGYAYPRRPEEQDQAFQKRHLDRNLTYVRLALEILKSSLERSEAPIIVTCGSQWSYRPMSDCQELAPYIKAKHALREYTEDFALRNPKIRANHYCIPTSETQSYRRIEENFKILGKDIRKSHQVLANPMVVARSLVEHALQYRRSGMTLVCEPNGLIKAL